jgi:hypothetical protein
MKLECSLSCLVALAVVLVPTPALSQDTGAVLEFRGWRSGAARKAVTKGVAEVVDLTEEHALADAVDLLPSGLSTPEGRAALASELDLTVVVSGRVKGRGSRARTVIVVSDRFGARLAARKVASPLRASALASAAADLVESVLDEASSTRESALENGARPNASRTPVRAARVAIRATTPRTTDEYLPPGPITPSSVERAAASPRRTKAPARSVTKAAGAGRVQLRVAGEDDARRWLSVRTLLHLRDRAAKIDLSDDRTASHRSGFFPEIGFEIDARPFSRPGLRGLRGAFRMAVGVGLSSMEDGDQRVDTSALRLSAELGYDHDFDAFQVGATLGLGTDSFSLGTNDVIGSAAYTYVRTGFFAAYRLLDERVVVGLDFGVRPVTTTGDLGIRYFQTVSATGIDVQAGLSGRFEGGFTYSAGVGFLRYGLDFENALSERPEQLADLAIATGGSDASLLLKLQAGWVFD